MTMIKVWLLLVLGLLSALSAAQENVSGILATREQQAEILMEEKRWIDLENYARKWVQEEGQNKRSHYFLAQAMLNQQRLEEALQSFEWVLNLSKKRNEKLILQIADLQVDLERWEKARENYKNLLDTNESRPDIWDRLRFVLEKQYQNDSTGFSIGRELTEVYEKLLSFGAYLKKGEYWRRYADLLDQHLSDQDGARKAYQNLLNLGDKDIQVAEWVYNYDVEAADNKKLTQSRKHLRSLSPNHPYILLYEANLHMEREEFEEAEKLLSNVSEGEFPILRAEALVNLGNIKGLQRKPKAAFDFYKSAIEADPENWLAWEGAVIMLRERGQYKLSRKFFRRLRLLQERQENNQKFTAAEALSGLCARGC